MPAATTPNQLDAGKLSITDAGQLQPLGADHPPPSSESVEQVGWHLHGRHPFNLEPVQQATEWAVYGYT